MTAQQTRKGARAAHGVYVEVTHPGRAHNVPQRSRPVHRADRRRGIGASHVPTRL
jgi:hypothetical protein